MTTQSFVIATHNPAKQREIGQILEFTASMELPMIN